MKKEFPCWNIYDKNDSPSCIYKNYKEDVFMKYECVCGYIYDPAVGDPDSGIAPNTKFEDIPDDWVCPVCGLDKSAFTPID